MVSCSGELSKNNISAVTMQGPPAIFYKCVKHPGSTFDINSKNIYIFLLLWFLFLIEETFDLG